MNTLPIPGTDLVLRDPTWLLAGLLVPIAWAWGRRRVPSSLRWAPAALLRRGEGLARPSGAPSADPPLPSTWRTSLTGLPPVLQAVALLLLALAVARPVRFVPERDPVEGIDLLLCLDVSSSMRQEDMAGGRTRLDVAQEAAARFVAARRRDRIGLLTFARWADLRCPTTLDHGALTRLLAEVAPLPSDDPEDATGIGTALARAAQALRDRSSPSRVVVLLTDGEENVAPTAGEGEIAPLHAAQLCVELGVRVHVVVVGRGRASPAGVRASPDPGPTREVARRTGGLFLEAADARALGEVYGRIDLLERSAFREERTTTEDGFVPFLLGALGLLLLARLLETTTLGTLP